MSVGLKIGTALLLGLWLGAPANAQAPAVVVETEGHPSRGPGNAPVTLLEFSDFECPFCARLLPTMERLKEKYGENVRWVFRQFPLGIHPNAQKAAEASLCANDQGRFWKMHDLLFERPVALSETDLVAKATRLDLDMVEFRNCLETGQHVERVLREGFALGEGSSRRVCCRHPLDPKRLHQRTTHRGCKGDEHLRTCDRRGASEGRGAGALA